MLRKIFNVLVLIPLAAIFVVFAVANRHRVTVSFDPFNTADPAIGVALPLFIVIILVAMMGVVAGGVATWLRQGRWRRAARQHEADAREARAQLADLRDRSLAEARAERDRSMALIPARNTVPLNETSTARRCRTPST